MCVNLAERFQSDPHIARHHAKKSRQHNTHKKSPFTHSLSLYFRCAGVRRSCVVHFAFLPLSAAHFAAAREHRSFSASDALVDRFVLFSFPGADLQLAAELGKTLLERNKALELSLKQKQTVIDDQEHQIEVRMRWRFTALRAAD